MKKSIASGIAFMCLIFLLVYFIISFISAVGNVSVARKTSHGSIIFEIESDFDTVFHFRGERHTISRGKKAVLTFA